MAPRRNGLIESQTAREDRQDDPLVLAILFLATDPLVWFVIATLLWLGRC